MRSREHRANWFAHTACEKRVTLVCPRQACRPFSPPPHATQSAGFDEQPGSWLKLLARDLPKRRRKRAKKGKRRSLLAHFHSSQPSRALLPRAVLFSPDYAASCCMVCHTQSHDGSRENCRGNDDTLAEKPHKSHQNRMTRFDPNVLLAGRVTCGEFANPSSIGQPASRAF